MHASSAEKHFNHLHLLEEIGQGTFRVVHKAIWRGKIVAAKVVRVEAGTTARNTLLTEMEAIRCDNSEKHDDSILFYSYIGASTIPTF